MRNMDMMDAMQGDITNAIRSRQRVLSWPVEGVVFEGRSARLTFLLRSSVARPVMATPTRLSASAKLRTKHQLWLHFLRSSLSKAAATSRFVEMMREEATLSIIPITQGEWSKEVTVGWLEPMLSGVILKGAKTYACPVKFTKPVYSCNGPILLWSQSEI